MRPEKLQAALTERQREAGLYLEEPDDDVLQLKRGRSGSGDFFPAWRNDRKHTGRG